MDESRSKQRWVSSRSVRRLALLAAINCSLAAPSLPWCHAADQATSGGVSSSASPSNDARPSSNASASDLRSLLAEGWNSTTPQNLSTDPSASAPPAVARRLLSSAEAPSILTPSTQVESGASTQPVADHVIRLTPIQIDAAQEISIFSLRKPASNARYADLGNRRDSVPVQPKNTSDVLPSLPRSSANSASLSNNDRRDSAFTLPPLPSAASRQSAQGHHADTNHVPTANARDDFAFGKLKSDALRSIAGSQGFDLWEAGDSAAATRVEPRSASESSTSRSRSSSPVNGPLAGGATIHASKLGDIARVQLRDATSRLGRGAVHSAKKLTVQALRNFAAMQDAHDGDTQHASHLDAAMTAIRESEDFSGKFGAVDQRSLQRLVVAHQTTALKGRDLQHISPMRATEAYLAVAREEIVRATARVPMASDALVLLGRIEAAISDEMDPRGGAVTLAMHQAAVEVDPDNSRAWLALGTTMAGQGLMDESRSILVRSIELQPSRRGYEHLLGVANRLQDASTIQTCQRALKDPRLKLQTPVRHLKQDDFAALYKPANSVARNATSQLAKTPGATSGVEAKPVSSKGKRFSLLRSWVMPKKRL